MTLLKLIVIEAIEWSVAETSLKLSVIETWLELSVRNAARVQYVQCHRHITSVEFWGDSRCIPQDSLVKFELIPCEVVWAITWSILLRTAIGTFFSFK